MKRTLISYDVFESIQNESLSTTEFELKEAAPYLSRALGEDLKLNCFSEQNALYESIDGKLIHTSYDVKNNQVVFENIEQLTIDTDSEKGKSREVLGGLVDALLENKSEQADQIFLDYMKLPHVKRNINEAIGSKKKERKVFEAKNFKGKITIHEDQLKPWFNLSENVFDFVNSRNAAPVMKETSVKNDNKGNVVSVKVPNYKLRNEAKVLSFDWDCCPSDVHVLRSKGKTLHENVDFCKAVGDLKRQNNLSDNEGLEESLETIVSTWPEVLYLTQEELSGSIKTALETVQAKNFDEQTCDFMAEGILRTAHFAYVDKVEKILKGSKTELDESVEDKYSEFKNTVDNFYPSVDEANQLQMQMFVDLYESLRSVFSMAKDQNQQDVVTETAKHLNMLGVVIQGQVQPKLETAYEAAEWLNYLIDTNIDSHAWNVEKSHVDASGNHPFLNVQAQHGYSPSGDFSGDYKSAAPVSQGDWKMGKGADGAKEMSGNAWGNIGGNEVFPSLNNPYAPKTGNATMKGEKGADKDDMDVSSKDTWPQLQNPYAPKAVAAKSLVVKE